MDDFEQQLRLNQLATADHEAARIETMRPSLFYAPSVVCEKHPYGGQTLFHQSTHPVRFLCPGNGYGKGIRKDDKVLTPKGWCAIGELVVGDRVIGGDGKPCWVLGVYPQGPQPTYKLTFNDGSNMVCDEQHLHQVQLRNNRFLRPGREDEYGQWQVINTKVLIERVGMEPSPVQRPIIPMVGQVELDPQPVPIEPYTLGLLLGDGSFGVGVSFCKPDDELHSHLSTTVVTTHRQTGLFQARTSGCLGLRPHLKALGLDRHRSWEKFVPAVYLWNSPAVRLAVLQGLLDTDGYCADGKIEFCSTSSQLAQDVVFLVQSLGGKAKVHVKERPTFSHRGELRVGRPAYRVFISMLVCPFRLNRKAARWRPNETEHCRILRTIEDAGVQETVCISVNSPDQCFVTEHFIVTHNSACMGHEANAWATHSNRWQKTPDHPVSMIWFGPGSSQWRKLRKELLEPYCFDRPFEYRIAENAYQWPDGSRLEFRSYEAGWFVEQGVNPDIIFFDEMFDQALWIEMQMRRRGRKKTRFVIAATQTLGTSWMEEDLYRRWLDHHLGLGLSEEEGMLAQKHHYIWCWPIGGIKDNPVMTVEDINHYEQNIVFSSDAERKVRLRGGFGDWSGTAVFDMAGVRWLQEQAKLVVPLIENGTIVVRQEAA
jgi:hypothetical protein